MNFDSRALKLDGSWADLERETFALTGCIRQDRQAAKNFSNTIKDTKSALRPYLIEIRERLKVDSQGARNDLHPDTPKIGWQQWVRDHKTELGFSLATANRYCGDERPKPEPKPVNVKAGMLIRIDDQTYRVPDPEIMSRNFFATAKQFNGREPVFNVTLLGLKLVENSRLKLKGEGVYEEYQCTVPGHPWTTKDINEKCILCAAEKGAVKRPAHRKKELTHKMAPRGVPGTKCGITSGDITYVGANPTCPECQKRRPKNAPKQIAPDPFLHIVKNAKNNKRVTKCGLPRYSIKGGAIVTTDTWWKGIDTMPPCPKCNETPAPVQAAAPAVKRLSAADTRDAFVALRETVTEKKKTTVAWAEEYQQVFETAVAAHPEWCKPTVKVERETIVNMVHARKVMSKEVAAPKAKPERKTHAMRKGNPGRTICSKPIHDERVVISDNPTCRNCATALEADKADDWYKEFLQTLPAGTSKKDKNNQWRVFLERKRGYNLNLDTMESTPIDPDAAGNKFAKALEKGIAAQE